jgi:ABC-type antimicrobial peptide transport system permease subunit
MAMRLGIVGIYGAIAYSVSRARARSECAWPSARKASRIDPADALRSE